jgi:hypothetical protein
VNPNSCKPLRASSTSTKLSYPLTRLFKGYHPCDICSSHSMRPGTTSSSRTSRVFTSYDEDFGQGLHCRTAALPSRVWKDANMNMSEGISSAECASCRYPFAAGRRVIPQNNDNPDQRIRPCPAHPIRQSSLASRYIETMKLSRLGRSCCRLSLASKTQRPQNIS